MKSRKVFEVESLIVTFIVIAICEVFFLMDVLADAFHIDIATPWIDHAAIELISTITLAFALLAIGWQIRQLLMEHRVAQASVKVASGELLAVIYTRFDGWQLTPQKETLRFC